MDNQVRIVSDGTPIDTKVTRLSDGKPIERVIAATVHIEAREYARVDLEILGPVVDVSGGVQTVHTTCPVCDHVSEHSCQPSTLGS